MNKDILYGVLVILGIVLVALAYILIELIKMKRELK